MALGRGDNLTIGIGIDTAKLRADAALVKAELQKINREVAAAARAGDLTRLTAATQQQDAAIRQLRRFNDELRLTTKTLTESSPAIAKLGENFSILHSKILLSVGAITGATAAILAFAKSAATSVDETSDTAKALGITVDEYRRFVQAGRDAKFSQDEVNTLLFQFSRHLGSAQEEERKLAGESLKLKGAVDILRGGMEKIGTAGTVLRGSVKGAVEAFGDTGTILRGNRTEIVDNANAFTKLQIPLKNNAGEFKGLTEQIKAFGTGLNRVGDASDRSARSQEAFGRAFSKVPEFLEKLKALEGVKIPVPTQKEEDAADSFVKAWGRLLGQLSRTREVIGTPIADALVPQFDRLRTALNDNEEVFRQWSTNVVEFVRKGIADSKQAIDFVVAAAGLAGEALNKALTFDQQITDASIQAVKDAWNGLVSFFTDLGTTISGIWTNTWNAVTSGATAAFNSIIEKFNAAKSAIGSLFGGSNTTTTTAPAEQTFARGGSVHGPGTGRSDSIWARVSNGEFVMQARAVQRWGLGMMHALNNGFAMGGLVGAPPIGFAAGGLVSTSSSAGRPVHLHLGGQSFALSGTTAVVDALVSHAHSQQIRSTGVKPSWFAARPSGR